MNEHYVVLAGGVGAAKFIDGLAEVVEPEELKIIVNTGDDIELFGLTICPDLDIITYTLADLIDKEKGWGFAQESFKCLEILKKYYNFGWFNAGDKDLATHIYRTDLIRRGYTKQQITQKICNKLAIKAEIIPMSNEPVETIISTRLKSMHFEEYYIRYQCKPEILDIKFKGIKHAKASEGILDYIKNAKKIIICPSNPIVSIGTIIKIRGVKEALVKRKSVVYGISPIIQGAPVKGPADKLMKHVSLPVSCYGVACYYKDFLGHFVIDLKDSAFENKINNLGISTYCFDTLMTDQRKKKNLAQFVLNL